MHLPFTAPVFFTTISISRVTNSNASHLQPAAPRRVLVIGATGAGKTTLITTLTASGRSIVFLESPREFLRELVAGAPPADAAIWAVAANDASQQTHVADLLRMLGVHRIAITKLDLAADAFEAVECTCRKELERVGIEVGCVSAGDDGRLLSWLAEERAPAPLRFAAREVRTRTLKASVFWDGNRDLTLGAGCLLKISTETVECEVVSIENVIDSVTLKTPPVREGSGFSRFSRSDLAEVTFETRQALALDNHERVPALGRFVLVEDGQAIGGGIVIGGVYTDRRAVKSQNITWSEGAITRDDRFRRNRHRGAVVWLTGLSGAGKSTLAHELERELFERQFHVYVLDGDNVRHGLNANLGFSPEDRLENVRRVGEVARLMADSGLVTLTAFISPYRADRRRAREIALEGGCEFIEIFVDASLAECERRDPKNLYKKARAGQIKQFTGIDAPYERPENPEIVVRTDQQTAAESVALILESLLPRLRME